MGTSTSSKGPSSGVSFDPPWLIDFPIQPPQLPNLPDLPAFQPLIPGLVPPEAPQSAVAPPRRFSPARTSLSKYMATGDREYLKRSLGHYSRKGMGGAHILSRRMRASAGVAAAIYDLFTKASDENVNWLNRLVDRNLPIEDATNEIIAYLFPIGGSMEEENCKASIAYALMEMDEQFPNANLSKLGNDEIWFLIEHFVAYEAKQRIIQDIGQILEHASANDMVIITNDMTSFLHSHLSVQIRKRRNNQASFSRNAVAELIVEGIKDTFSVFEEELCEKR